MTHCLGVRVRVRVGIGHVLADNQHTAAVDMYVAPATIMLWGEGREVHLKPQPSQMSYWQKTVIVFFTGVATAKLPVYQ